MISDGWGYNQVMATNYFQGVNKQSYERFPVKAAMSTYEDEGAKTPPGTSNIIGYDPVAMWNDFAYAMGPSTDSASAATAMASGDEDPRWLYRHGHQRPAGLPYHPAS